jgi:predicted amidohydrolase
MPLVAAIQFAPVFRQKRENQRRLVKLIEQAAGAGAKLIVMPELATTGYSYMSPEEARVDAEVITLEPAIRANDEIPTTRLMAALASKFNVHLVWGMIEEEAGTGKLYNSQVYVDPFGYLESMRKINRWANDFLWAESGRANPPIVQATIDGVEKKVGLLICRDVRDKVNDDWKNLYSPGDADIVAFSSNWGEGGFPATAWMDFAMENKVFLVVSNRYGEEGDKPNRFGGGGVCVVEPCGKVHCKGLVWSTDCIVYAEVS